MIQVISRKRTLRGLVWYNKNIYDKARKIISFYGRCISEQIWYILQLNTIFTGVQKVWRESVSSDGERVKQLNYGAMEDKPVTVSIDTDISHDNDEKSVRCGLYDW